MDARKLKKNPSRKECEAIIRRILMTEVLEKGRNSQFRNAADFMPYFESLYPASDSLKKQVQRALHEMNLPHTEEGYLVVNKTAAQLEEDNAIGQLLAGAGTPAVITDAAVLFLPVCSPEKEYLREKIASSVTFRGKYLTIADSSDGLLFLTSQPSQLLILLKSLSSPVEK